MGKYNTQIKPSFRGCKNVKVECKIYIIQRKHRRHSSPTKSAWARSKEPARRSTPAVPWDERRKHLRDIIYRAQAQAGRKRREESVQIVKTEELDNLSSPAVVVDEPSTHDAETEKAWSLNGGSLYADGPEGSPADEAILVDDEEPSHFYAGEFDIDENEGLPAGSESLPTDDGGLLSNHGSPVSDISCFSLLSDEEADAANAMPMDELLQWAARPEIERLLAESTALVNNPLDAHTAPEDVSDEIVDFEDDTMSTSP